MALKEVWINNVTENHEVDATIMWTKTDVEGNSRVDLLQVGWVTGRSISSQFCDLQAVYKSSEYRASHVLLDWVLLTLIWDVPPSCLGSR